MVTISRKEIENFYEQEWAKVISLKAINVLVEVTCQSYHLNQPEVFGYIKEEIPKPQDLGQI